MLGIEALASYLPEVRRSNLDLAGRFEVDETFLQQKLGVLERREKAVNEETSDLACAAITRLLTSAGIEKDAIEALVVVTQTPDHPLPHVSAIVHGKLNLPPYCAAFDVSLGCSGYVYGLSVMKSFLESNALKRGVLVTADPYSKIVDRNDKNTALLFGDAATATLIGPDPVFVPGPFSFGTHGALHQALICREGVLSMNGREIFNFTATSVPKDLDRLLTRAGVSKESVDCYILHQGSKYIVDTIAKRAGLPPNKVRFDIAQTGNTVSSSIPLLLERELGTRETSTVVLSGFGVGLSWASCILKRSRYQ